ncbi:MAG: PDZ domain-containing protein, partial [Methylophilaceae bacterium]
HAAENLFEKHYKEQNAGNLQSLQANPQTAMYVSNHKDEDNISMLENGYDLMGSSGFEAGDVKPELALQHAKSIKADTVLVYTKYASKQTSLSNIEAIKPAAKTTGEIDEKDLKQAEEKYKYYASYWAKLPMPLLGVHIIKLKPVNADGTADAENGLKVLAVIKDSPAAKANLLRGDVLLKMGSIELEKPETLSLVARQYQGKTVEIAYERNGQPAVTTANLNSR